MPKDSDSRTITDRILMLAADRHGIVSREILLRAGFSKGLIDARIESRWLHPAHRGVYAVGLPASTERAVLMAAVLASGPGAVLSGRSACALWGLFEWRGPVEIMRPHTRRPSRFSLTRPGVTGTRAVLVSRSDRILDRDVAAIDGLPVTSVVRSLLGFAAISGIRQTRRAFNEADRIGLLDTEELFDCCSRGSGWAGATAMRRLVETRHPETRGTESELETLFLHLCRQEGLPQPIPNPTICGYRVDCLWADQRLIVELDGFAFHRGRMAFERDAQRENDLKAGGYRVLRFTYDMVTRRPSEVVQLLRSELRAAQPPFSDE